ncbi:MAG: hypothetical protein FJW38_24880 [Acidobacteria bacterium]|nr:hypothetical protein [Acidobacteriota bacterium]
MKRQLRIEWTEQRADSELHFVIAISCDHGGWNFSEKSPMDARWFPASVCPRLTALAEFGMEVALCGSLTRKNDFCVEQTSASQYVLRRRMDPLGTDFEIPPVKRLAMIRFRKFEWIESLALAA